jgi:hypothetical protein
MESPIWLGFFRVEFPPTWGEPGRQKYVIYPIYFTGHVFYNEAETKNRKSFPVRGV